MGSADNFCLRWNDFETNISSSFRELRRDSEFFDVTLCCDNGSDKVGAHKVILAACSPFFRRILSHNADRKNPLLYLKGIQKRELQAILNFMYHGEVNVAQDSLNAFLSVAEELAVKGLTTDSKPLAWTSDGATASTSKALSSKQKQSQQPLPSSSLASTSPATPSSSGASGSKSRSSGGLKQDVQGEFFNAGPSEEGEDSAAKKIKPEPELGAGAADDSYGGGGDDYGGEGFDDSYTGYEDMDESGMDGSELTKVEEAAEEDIQFDGNEFKTDDEIQNLVARRKERMKLARKKKFDEKYPDGLNTTWGRAKANKEKRERGEKVLKKGSLEDAVEAVWLKGKKGTLLKDPVEGFVYARNTTKGGSITFWRCRWRQQLKCKGTAKTDGFYLVSRYHTHNHSPTANPIADSYNSQYVELNLGKKEVEFKDE